MASAAPNTAVPLPTATATSATIGIAAPPVSTMHATPAVSYTHLDVYKRQVTSTCSYVPFMPSTKAVTVPSPPSASCLLYTSIFFICPKNSLTYGCHLWNHICKYMPGFMKI